MRFLIALSLLLAASLGFCQGTPPVNKEVIEAMKEFAFITGEWEGEGWIIVNGQKHTTSINEKIIYKAGNTVLTLEGLGKDASGKVTHNAYGFMYYDAKSKEYRMRSFLAQGVGGEFKATAKNGVIVWTIPSERTIRYTIKLDADGNWNEIGEVDLGNGKWFQFMETKLKKVK
jgi:hypothetical protein